MIIPEFNPVSYREKSLRIVGPKLWNSLPYHNKNLLKIQCPLKEQLRFGMEKVAFVRLVVVNKLISRFKVDILCLLKLL